MGGKKKEKDRKIEENEGQKRTGDKKERDR